MSRINPNDEKKLGVVYTPPEVAQFMCEHSFLFYLNHIMKSDGNVSYLTVDSVCNENTTERLEMIEKIISEVKVFDPAVGTGIFLVEFSQLLKKIYKSIDFKLKRQRSEIEIAQSIISHNLFGKDVDPESIKQCKIAIIAQLILEKSPMLLHSNMQSELPSEVRKVLDNNIIVADSLAVEKNLNFPSKFDIVIGNPPYISCTAISESLKNQLKKSFLHTYHANGDIYYVFFELGLQSLKENGIFAYITPRYFFRSPTGSKLRTYLSQFTILNIIDFGNIPVFGATGIHPAITLISASLSENKKDTTNRTNYCSYCSFSQDLTFETLVKELPNLSRGMFNSTQTLTSSIFQIKKFNSSEFKKGIWNFTNEELQSMNDLTDSKVPLGRICIISKGIQTGRDDVFVIDENTKKEWNIEDEALKPFLKNRDIQSFKIKPRKKLYVIYSPYHIESALSRYPNLSKYLVFKENELKTSKSGSKRSRTTEADPKKYRAQWYHWRQGDERVTLKWDEPKIIGRYKGDMNIFALDNKGYYFSQDVIFIQPYPEYTYLINYLLDFLNSTAFLDYARSHFKELGINYFEFYPHQLESVPVPLPSPDTKTIFKI